MRISASTSKIAVIGLMLALLAGCKNGGKLALEPPPHKVTIKGSPSMQMNDGGRSIVVEQGKTASTGVHGWIAVQSVVGKSLTDGSGRRMMVNQQVPPTGP